MKLSRLAAYVREHGPMKTAARVLSRASQALEVAALKLQRASVVQTRYGVRMRVNWSDATFRFCYFGLYGQALADLLDKHADPFVFLDIGANQGLYSLIAARNPSCKSVLAFEPVPSTFELLSANVALDARIQARAHCIKAGIANERRTQQIFIDPAHSGLSSLNRNHAQQGITQTIELITHRELDELLRKHAPEGLNMVVKIDVEGYEEIVASELMKLACADRIQSVFYEADDRWTSRAAMRSTFEAGGFSNFATFAAGSHYDVLATRQPRQRFAPQSAMTA